MTACPTVADVMPTLPCGVFEAGQNSKTRSARARVAASAAGELGAVRGGFGMGTHKTRRRPRGSGAEGNQRITGAEPYAAVLPPVDFAFSPALSNEACRSKMISKA